MLEVFENLGLLGIALRPFPFLQQLLVPGEAVDVGVGIAARAGVTVPVPSAADGLAGLVDARAETEFVPERFEHVNAGEACADDDGVEALRCTRHLPLPSIAAERRMSAMPAPSGEYHNTPRGISARQPNFCGNSRAYAR